MIEILCFLVLITCLVYGLALLSWLVMKLDIEKRRSKRTKFFEMIGGTLMEIEKLIEALGNLEMCAYGYHINGEVLGMDCTDFECLMVDAAEEISKIPALQAENDRLKEGIRQMQWIPVEERLPMPCENPVLVYDNSGVGMAWYSSTMGWMYRTGLGCVDITHWMHLPKAPKEEIL